MVVLSLSHVKYYVCTMAKVDDATMFWTIFRIEGVQCALCNLGFQTTLAHKQADAEHDPWLLHKYRPIAGRWFHGQGISKLLTSAVRPSMSVRTFLATVSR